MPLPFPTTAARQKVFANVRALQDDGYTRGAAIAEAFNAARKAWFARYPAGALPEWLAYDAKYRLSQYYLPSGAFIKQNPVPAQTRAAARLYRAFTGHAPVNAVDASVPGAGFSTGFIVGNVLGLDLHTNDDLPLGHLKFSPASNRPALAISSSGAKCAFIGGDWHPVAEYTGLDAPIIIGIMYETVRDGVHEKYHHPFAHHARPLLQLLDGRNARMSGGSFKFTDRGFLDK